jgi:hypothetical protein
MLGTLADLLAPVTVPAFLEAVHGRSRLHVRATDAGRAETLLPWEEVERLTSTPAVLAEVDLMKDGMLVPAQLYASDGALEGPPDRRLDVRAFHDILGQGASIVVRDIARWVPGIERLAVAIERELGIDTIVNGYLSFSRGGAFRPHWDRHDVLIVQIHGRKLWRLWDAPVADPVRRSSESKYVPTTPAALEVELSPGDVFFIPRGQPHAATVSGESSVHLTIGLNTRNGIDFLHHLGEAAQSDEFLRAALPRGDRGAAAGRHEEELKRRLHRLIDQVSLEDFFRADDLRRVPSQRTGLASLPPRPDDRLRLTLRRRVPLSGTPAVVIGGRSVALGAAEAAVLAWLYDHDRAPRAVLLEALAPVHAPSAVDAAIRQLMHAGLVVAERAV